MGEVLKFFKNSLKALFFSPYYLIVYVFSIIRLFVVFIIGFFKDIFSLFRYTNRKTFPYEKQLRKAKLAAGVTPNN